MPSYSRNEIVIVEYPFSDLSGTKIRPGVVIGAPHISQDVFIVPLTSRTTSLIPGEFVLVGWRAAGLNVASAIKRGIYTIHSSLIIKRVGNLVASDSNQLENSLRTWLGLR
jgi:mRNA interferase MazF